MSATTVAAPAPRAPAPARAPVVAMVGAGQLARMTHQAAIGLGVRVRVLAEGPGDPAVLAGAEPVVGRPERLDDLRALARGADVVTFDHERIPPEHLAALEAAGRRLAPSPAANLLAQDKLLARRVLRAAGLPVPPFAHACRREEAEAFGEAHGWPLVGKAPRGGYDGRGVFVLDGPGAAAERIAASPAGLLLEPHLPLERELSVLVARARPGDRVAYPVAETVQRDAMCREILAPAPVDPGLAAGARDLALAVAEAVDAVGVLAVELFATPGGLLVNELALRPHNSGHWTIEGATTSQFEQHLRAVLGWPLGPAGLAAPAVATVNVVGPPDGSDPAHRLAEALAVPGAHVHLYAKAPRPGRKLGHVTVLAGSVEEARAAARRAAALLEGGDR